MPPSPTEHTAAGSLWRKWDLQVHVPGSNHADQYKAPKSADAWNLFLDHLSASGVSAFGIADYFSIQGYETLLNKVDKDPRFEHVAFFPNVELRLDISTNKDAEEINIHLLFDPRCDTKLMKQFLANLETTGTKHGGAHYRCTPEDLAKLGYAKASVSLAAIKKALADIDSPAFPEEVEFNPNLCSIIGSRSSGKSALLAYIAHSIDPVGAEKLVDGPGDGEAYHWDRVDTQCAVEWANGKNSTEISGKVVYIPQGHLFDASKDPNQIKAKIEPVLFKVLPGFAAIHQKAEKNIAQHNRRISSAVDQWFAERDSIESIQATLKSLGDRDTVTKEKERVETRIEELKTQSKLNDDDLKRYKEYSSSFAQLQGEAHQVTEDLELLATTDDQGFFSDVSAETTPSLELLPQALRAEIQRYLSETQDDMKVELNKRVLVHKTALQQQASKVAQDITQLTANNQELLDRYKQHTELEAIMKTLAKHEETIKHIDSVSNQLTDAQNRLKGYGDVIKTHTTSRATELMGVKTALDGEDQAGLNGISVGVEFDYRPRLEAVSEKINVKNKTPFVDGHLALLDAIRKEPSTFLESIYTGTQKLTARNDKREVTREILRLTETILFFATMEGDRIGGLVEPTMTSGKRALFALKLILAESEDTWPLLVDQPEDDLDSRSIYDEIVPFLKEKKKGRQIIMASHNANFVIGADSEQVIVANRNGQDRPNADGKEFNYLTGPIEYTKAKKANPDTLAAQGIREHACEILDGGSAAFEHRRNKYSLGNRR